MESLVVDAGSKCVSKPRSLARLLRRLLALPPFGFKAVTTAVHALYVVIEWVGEWESACEWCALGHA